MANPLINSGDAVMVIYNIYGIIKNGRKFKAKN